MGSEPRSRLWVYTGRDDLLYTSLDAHVQDRYYRCIVSGTRYHAAYCVLRYLLEEADFPGPAARPGKVYVYTAIYVKTEEGSRRRVLVLQTDGCSLLNIVAVADARGLTYAEAQRVVANNMGIVVPLAPPSLQLVIDYDVLGKVLAGIGAAAAESVIEEALQRQGALKRAMDVGVLPSQCPRDSNAS